MLRIKAGVSRHHFTCGGEFQMTYLKRLWKEEEGQDLTEYALLLALIALAAIVTMKSLATAINAVFSNAAANLSTTT
jgi:pilus assembly protein Flp/PilA